MEESNSKVKVDVLGASRSGENLCADLKATGQASSARAFRSMGGAFLTSTSGLGREGAIDLQACKHRDHVQSDKQCELKAENRLVEMRYSFSSVI